MKAAVTIILICVAVTVLPGHCEKKESQDNAKSRLPEFLSELDLASLEASEEDVEALKKIAKRLAPEKNGEYQVYQVFFGNEDLLKEWLKGAGVSGQPGVDFPTFTTIPATSFSCRGLKGGYYADLETNCQVFHICDNGRKISFLCPNGTIFQQSQLICDWWFKVDCSKSTELYEQSAEQLAEEERKRTEDKKMKSEFHRTVDHDGLDYHQGQDNYDGRQNGRTNPFGQSVRPNQIQDNADSFKSQFKQNNVFDQSNGRSGSQFAQNSNSNNFQSNEQDFEENFNIKPKQGPAFNYRTINRQQNQLLDTQNGKYNQYNPSYEEKFQESSQDNPDQSNNSQDYYGSAGTQNVARNERPNSRNPKARGNYVRNLNNLNSPTQKATSAYMETTTFRTTTSSPIKEFQQFAESAAFVSNRGNYYNNNAANRQFYYQSYNSNNNNNNNNQETTTKDPASIKEKSSSPALIRTRFSIPPFPGPTFAPIYKPRTTTIPSRETTLQYTTTTEKTLDSTDYYRQPYTTETSYSFGGGGGSSGEIVTTTNRLENEDYQTSTESISTAALNENYQENSETPAAYRTNVDSNNSNQATFTDYYLNNNEYNTNKVIESDQELSYTTTRSNVNTDNSREYTEDLGTTVASNDYSNNVLERQNFGNSEAELKISTKEPTRNSPSYRINSINASTEKPSRSTQQYSQTGKTLSPYDTSFTYKQGKVMSTLGPYIPFTKNYIHSSTSTSSTTTPTTTTTTTTAKPPVYTATVPSLTSTLSNYRNPKNLISKSKQFFSSSNKLKGSSSTYLPESRSTLRIGTALENRPANEREHVLDMLHSLRGLENDVNTSGISRPSFSTASGPSTLHSLALYFATASENFASKESTESTTDHPEEMEESSTEKKNDSSIELPKSILTQQTVESYAELFKLNNALEINDTRIEDSNEYENSSDDLDLQQSEGPVNGANKTNGTKLRELAQVFTHALSAYLQDPDTFKKVLTDIRPTDPTWTTESDQSETTTSYPSTITEEFPSVTKEKDEVLDFSEDVNGSRRRKPTSVYPSMYQPSIVITSSTYKPYLSQRDFYGSTLPPAQIARRDFYTTAFPETYRRDVYNSTLSPVRSVSSVSHSATRNTNRPLEDNSYQTTTWLPPRTQNSYYTTTITPLEDTLDQTTTSSLNDLSNNDYYESSTVPTDNFAYVVNSAFNSGNDNRVPVSSVETSDSNGSSQDDYFPLEYKSEENQSGDSSNETTFRSDPYGKNVKPAGITPIYKNYVPSSTPAYYLQYAQDSYQGSKSERFGTPHYFKPEDNNNNGGSAAVEVSNSIIPSSTTSIPPKRITNSPFRIRYYDSRIPDESLVTARSSYQNFRTQNRIESNVKQTDKTTTERSAMTSISSSNQIGLDPITTTVTDVDDSSHVTTVTRNASSNNTIQNNTTSSILSNDHWTSSPMVTQLWESTIFIDPKRINHGLEDDPSSKELTSSETFSTLKPIRSSTLDSIKDNKIVTINTLEEATKSSAASNKDISTPWQWAPNNDDSPTTFTLLPSVFSGENTATPTPIYTTRSSITTTITSSVTSTNTIPQDNALVSLLPYTSTSSSPSNTSDNEVVKAKRIFGKLNESSSDTLMKVMKQADTNETVRQLVLLLINHCNGPMNKTMEEEKEQLLNALLRMPVNRFSSEESREIVAGINKLTLPIGRRSSSTTPRSSEPSITTFRSRQGRKFRTTTDNPSVLSRRSDDPETQETIDSLAETTVSDNRALDLLRSLYSVAAKWG
ncbi:PREDICTED: serine-rich adhesin for platelets isoform X1 [Polistes dominula]|uniref:Serine-rich adhesin for platelets isoform X1 n=1 Tax=Polistes dominula TaxID=743375 RepID=A0ABM1J727_POLDO|nr:PREDICTED: serine-rich adhesin for platelets isoform X1 [Polistes dominula]